MKISTLLGRLGLVALLLSAACAVNPVTGHRQVSLMSESQEISMGKEADPQIVAEYGLYDDPALAAYVDAVGQKMAKLSHRPNLEFTFRVLDSPVINAFALPGGYVYITRGILAHMNNEAELAIVLGHEIGHVTARHGAQAATRQQLAGLGLGLGSIFSSQIARYGQIAQEALGLMFLKYGRDAENQADDLGVEYSLRAGYDATVGCHFFEVLDRQQKESGSALPTWQSTHPAPADRVAHTQKLSTERRPQHPDANRIAESDLKTHVDGAVFGDDPRHGFANGNLFLHPQLNFQIAMPQGWKIVNTSQAVVAAAPDQKSAIQLTLENAEGLSPEAYAQKVSQAAQARVERGGSERIGGAPAWVGVLQVPSEQGSAVPVLVAWVQRPPGMFQMIGQGTAGQVMLTAMRSLADLADPGAKKIEPNRLKVEPQRSATTLAQAFEHAGTLPVSLGSVALLNNLQPESNLPAGFKLKLVRGTFKPEGPSGD
jgi:predicted Zn-dependent protease